jgi:hypothetical protein
LLEGEVENSGTIFRELIDSLDLATVKNNMEFISGGKFSQPCFKKCV